VYKQYTGPMMDLGYHQETVSRQYQLCGTVKRQTARYHW